MNFFFRNIRGAVALAWVLALSLFYSVAYGWGAFTHMLGRETIHLFSGPGVYLVALFGFWTLQRKVSWWPSLRGWTALIVPAFAALFGILAWEMWDGRVGGSATDPPIKSVIDVFGGWLAGLAGGVYGLYRIWPYWHGAMVYIDGMSGLDDAERRLRNRRGTRWS